MDIKNATNITLATCGCGGFAHYIPQANCPACISTYSFQSLPFPIHETKSLKQPQFFPKKSCFSPHARTHAHMRIMRQHARGHTFPMSCRSACAGKCARAKPNFCRYAENGFCKKPLFFQING